MTKIYLRTLSQEIAANNSRKSMCAQASTARIRELNDSFRKCFGANADNTPGMYITRGVSERGEDFQFLAIARVVSFDKFDADNDPYCEHDFGSFEIDGEELFWKIDAYDLKLEWGSPDPSNPNVTKRVLTIMLAEEY